MENYNINDAFKALEGLNEDIFSADDKGIEELRSFYDGDTDFEAEDIIDVEAKTKEDLKDSYVGHVILRCPICTTLIYKLPKEVILDEDTAYANVGEECPVCSSVDGWDIVGQVVDFDKESLNVEGEDDGEESDSGVKIKVDDEEVITESKHKRFKKLKEALNRNKRYRKLKESFDYGDDAVYRLRLLNRDGESSALENFSFPDDILDKYTEEYFTKDLAKEAAVELKKYLKSNPKVLNGEDITGVQIVLCMYETDDEDEEPYTEEEDVISLTSSFSKDSTPFSLGIFDKGFKVMSRLDQDEIKAIRNRAQGETLFPLKDAVVSLLLKLYDLNYFDIPNDVTEEEIKDYLESLVDKYHLEDRVKKLMDSSYEPVNESTGSDLAKYQKWVDYDMKRYGKISDITNDKLKRAGLEVVKDDHGDYEVISKEDNGKTLTEEKNSDKLKKRFPEYFGNIGGEARYKKDNHSRKMFKEALGTIYDAVLKILDDNGYDVEDSEVQEYANSAAEYIEMTRAETDGRYSVYRWFKDTKSNYPEELTGLKKLNESVDSVEVKTDKEEIEVDSDEGGKTTVEVKPRDEKDIIEGEETVVPVDDETKDEIEDNSIKVSDTNIDIDEFDEDEFDELEEKYLQKVYENVKSYKTTKGTIRGNKLILEGVIEFNSGKKVPTKNIFESAYRLKNGKLKFNGLNEQFSKNNKAFTLTGSLNNKKLIIESLNYNYSAKDNKSGKTQRIYGTIKK